ncbi:hypothetical protein GKQ38_00870 [Candidatus Nanohaloarchaea archaeon]|nr:hypothetical protein GKQ38_00870 [Candidatus Nanohaloarchaea archaeon]
MSDDNRKVRSPWSWRKDEYGSLRDLQTWKQIAKEFLSHKVFANIFFLLIQVTALLALGIAVIEFQRFGSLIFNLSFLCFTAGSVILAFEEPLSKFSSGLEEYHYVRTAHNFLYTGGQILLLHIFAVIIAGANLIPQDLEVSTTVEFGMTLAELTLFQGTETAIIFVFTYLLILGASSTFSVAMLYSFFIIFSTEFLGFEIEETTTPAGPIGYYKSRFKSKVFGDEE